MSILQFSTERDLVASTAELGARAIAANSGRVFVRNAYGWAPEVGGLFLPNGRRFSPSTRNTIALTGSSSSDRATSPVGGSLQERLNSDGYMYGANLATGQPWRIVKNYGISGASIGDIAPTLDTALSEYPALDFVVLQWFANDMGTVTPTSMESRIWEALHKCQAAGTKPIVIINWPQDTATAQDIADLLEYRTRMLALEAACPGELFVVDHWAEVAELGGYAKPGMLGDGVHLSQAGAKAVGRAWRSFAQRAFSLPDRWNLDQVGEPITTNWDFRLGTSGISWTASAATSGRIYEDADGKYAVITPTNNTTNGFLISRVDAAPVNGSRYIVAAELEVITPTKKLGVHIRNSTSTRILSAGRYESSASETGRGEFRTGERYMICTDPFDPLTDLNASDVVIGATCYGGSVKVRSLGVVQVG